MTLESRGLARSRDKLITIHLHHHNAYDYQTWQSGDMQRGAYTHKVKWPFDDMS